MSPYGLDVVAHAGRHGAQRLPLVVPVRVDDGDGQLRAHADDEAAHAQHLLRRQGDLRRRFRADDAVGVEPGVVHAEVDEPPQPRFLHEVVDVRSADAGGHARHQAVPGAGGQSRQRLVEDGGPAAPLVAHDCGALDADQRRHVAEPPQLSRPRVVYQVPVREELEVAVRVGREQVEQVGVQQRLASQNAEVAVAVPLSVADDAVELVDLDLAARRLDVDPAALAAQLTTRDDRDEEERREVLAPLQAPLVALHRADALDAHIPDQLAQGARVGLGEHPSGQSEHHVVSPPAARRRRRRRPAPGPWPPRPWPGCRRGSAGSPAPPPGCRDSFAA